MAFDAPVKCGIILENSSQQCVNDAWAYWDGLPKCRLHFAYDLAAADELPPNSSVINNFDNPDYKNMLEKKRQYLEEKKQQKEDAKEKEKGENENESDGSN